MICPNCGAETNESVCPFCGMNLGNENESAGENMQEQTFSANQESNEDMNMQQSPYEAQGVAQQNSYDEQGMNMQQTPYSGPDMSMQQNVYPGPDMNGAYQQPMDYQGTIPQKSHTGKVVGIIIGAVAVVIVLAIVGAVVLFGGVRKSEQIVDEFMMGMADGDTDKMVAYMDPDCIDDSDVEDLAYMFEMLEAWGMEYSIDYQIIETKKVSGSLIEEMCEEIYGDEKIADDISKAYISEVDYTVSMSYLDETETEDETIYLVCYKKDGEWYLGGSAEEE